MNGFGKLSTTYLLKHPYLNDLDEGIRKLADKQAGKLCSFATSKARLIDWALDDAIDLAKHKA